jgi:two-component system, chemotaxis family, CheB/CheR fusion protein
MPRRDTIVVGASDSMSRETQTDPDFERLLEYVKANRGFDFTGYKRPSLGRRTRRRMQALEIDAYGDYLDYLESNPDEFAELFNTILINVTGFFRDGEPWQYVAKVIAPRIVESKTSAETVRVWCPGCASGEDAYTATMVLAEVLGGEAKARLRVYATDVDEEALSKGRHASYTPKEVSGVPEHYRDKYFERDGAGYSFDRDLRRNVIFGRHNLVQDAPISRVDLLVCRNTLLYLNAETQNRVLENFNFALNDDGYLFLGKSEMLTRPRLFTPVDLKRRVFQRVARGELREGLRAFEAGDEVEAGPAELLCGATFEAGAAAQLVVDRHGVLVLVNRQARLLFGLADSDVGRPIQDLEVFYRPLELRSMIQQAYKEGTAVTRRDISWNTEAGSLILEVEVAPLISPEGGALGAGLTYLDVTRYSSLQDELERSKAALEAANEELRSTNDELETTNEELQSTNEELEAMNEELQSTNEELEAMNSEFREQTTELNRVNSFLETVLTGLGAAVVVLDESLRILAWNANAEQMWGVGFEEIRNQSFAGLDIGLPVAELSANIHACLRGGGPTKVTVPAVNRRGKQIRCRVQCKRLPNVAGDASGVLLLLEEQPAAKERTQTSRR